MSSTTNSSTPATDPGTPPFPHISVENILGAGLLGLAAVCLLNGVLFHQAYRYFREYGDDKRFLKIWVMIVVVLQTFISALQFHAMWFYLVQLYWDPTYFFLEKVVWSFNLLPVTALIHLPEGNNSACLTNEIMVALKIIAVVVFILNAGNMGCFVAVSVKMFGAADVADLASFISLSTVAAAIQMAGDVILTLALIYVFRKSRTGIGKTDSMLEVMIAYAVGTGAVNCIGHLLSVVFSIVYPRNWIFAFIACIDAKLYANGFLVALASRKFLAMSRFSDHASGPHWLSAGNVDVQSATIPRPRGMRMSNAATSPPTAIELKVRVVTEEVVEDDSDETRSNLKPAGSVV
ncbi:hypothetical protein V8D89_010587 [Ganoderma adspersum]